MIRKFLKNDLFWWKYGFSGSAGSNLQESSKAAAQKGRRKVSPLQVPQSKAMMIGFDDHWLRCILANTLFAKVSTPISTSSSATTYKSGTMISNIVNMWKRHQTCVQIYRYIYTYLYSFRTIGCWSPKWNIGSFTSKDFLVAGFFMTSQWHCANCCCRYDIWDGSFRFNLTISEYSSKASLPAFCLQILCDDVCSLWLVILEFFDPNHPHISTPIRKWRGGTT